MNHQQTITPKQVKGQMPSYNDIILKGGMDIPLCAHQKAMIRAYVEICAEKNDEFAPVTVKSIEKRLRSLPEANLIPTDLSYDIPVMHRKEWIKSNDPESFQLTYQAKALLVGAEVPA